MLRLVREHEVLAVRTSNSEILKKLSVWEGAPQVYVDDLIEFMNSDKELIRRFLVFVLEKEKAELEARKKKLEELVKYVGGLTDE